MDKDEAYRAAADAAVAELEEIESVVMSLEARIVKLRTRAKALGALLDAIHEVVPDAAAAPTPFAPAPPSRLGDDLPRRRRLRERGAPPSLPADPLLGEPRHVDPDTRPAFDPVPIDVEAWG